VLIPVSLSLILNSKFLLLNSILSVLFFASLIFTKSRSGFLGLALGLTSFWLLNLIIYKRKILKIFLILNFLFLILIILFGSPFPQINSFTFPGAGRIQTLPSTPNPYSGSLIDVGITESGNIRNIVWKGAINIFKSRPIIGTGVETFAFSYFQFRPVEHNMTSEWDFLYNKAHNEYLNFAANTGILGLGSYLLIIIVFIIFMIKSIKYQVSSIRYNKETKIRDTLYVIRDTTAIGLFSGWLTILVTNFFGFSVVIIQLFFFLIPAFIFIQFDQRPTTNLPREARALWGGQKVLSLSILLLGIYLLFRIIVLWLADFYFAKGYQAGRSQDFLASFENIKKAIVLNSKEPFYYDEFAVPAMELGQYLVQQQKSTESASYINQAIAASDKATSISPSNVSYWKTKTRILYALSRIDDSYLAQAIESLEQAKSLSPTDPKIHYNLALMYDAAGQKEKAYTGLDETIKLKINYRDAYLARAVYYQRDGQKDKAASALKFILERINPDDEEAKSQLEELQ